MTDYEKNFGHEALKEWKERKECEERYKKWQKEVSKNIKKELDKKGFLTFEEAREIAYSTIVS